MMLITLVTGMTTLAVAVLMVALQAQRIKCEQAAEELEALWREASVVRRELQESKTASVSKILPGNVPKSDDWMM